MRSIIWKRFPRQNFRSATGMRKCHYVLHQLQTDERQTTFPGKCLKANTVFYSMNCKIVSMNWLSNELQFAIHQIGCWDLQFIRQVLNSDAAAASAASAASAAASVSITAFAVVASEAAAEAAEAAAPAAASEFKTYPMNCKSKKPI